MSKEANQRQIKNQIEVTDLIAEAVVQASARRNQILDGEESLSELSDEQGKAINGGLLKPPIIFGYFPVEY